jgi:SAM-dependent methyltransferase
VGPVNEPTKDSEERRWAQRASSFGAEAAAYAEHRPDYPAAALRWALEASAIAPEKVLDLAAGTGKLTAGLLELGLEVIAVEPDAEMLAELSRTLPSVTALEGHAERIPLPDASVDAVFVGQAFHWFDPQPALTEIGRVLKPGGVLTALWNRDDDSVPWVAELAALGRTVAVRPETAAISTKVSNTDPEFPAHPAFTGFARETFPHAHRRTAESLIATVNTHSYLLVAGEEEAKGIRQELAEFLAARPETASGEFDLPLKTITVRLVRV